MTGPLPLSPLTRALAPRRRTGAPQMAGDGGDGAFQPPNIGGGPDGGSPDNAAHRGGLAGYQNAGDWVNAMMSTPAFGPLAGPQMAMGKGFAGSFNPDFLTTSELMAGQSHVGKGIEIAENISGMAPPSYNDKAIAEDAQSLMDQYGGTGPGGGNPGGVGVDVSTAEASAPGMFAGGGIVQPGDLRGPDPAGPDQGFVGVHPGEMILNQPQQMQLMRALRGRR